MPELLHQQPQEIGVIEPGLQDVGPHLAKNAIEPKQTARIRQPAANA